MKNVALSYEDIHDVVDNRRNAFWDGWTAVFVDTKRNGFMHPKGIYHNGRWAIAHRYNVGSDGKWRVPARYV